MGDIAGGDSPSWLRRGLNALGVLLAAVASLTVIYGLFMFGAFHVAVPLIGAETPDTYREAPASVDDPVRWRAGEIARVYCDELLFGCAGYPKAELMRAYDGCVAQATAELQFTRARHHRLVTHPSGKGCRLTRRMVPECATPDETFEWEIVGYALQLEACAPLRFPNTIWEMTRHINPEGSSCGWSTTDVTEDTPAERAKDLQLRMKLGPSVSLTGHFEARRSSSSCAQASR